MEFTVLQSGTMYISLERCAVIHVADEIEGDMTFTFKFIDDQEHNSGYTRYIVLDKFNAEIIISDPFNKSIRPGERIILGTYKYEYRLMLDFILSEQNEGENARKLQYVLFIGK